MITICFFIEIRQILSEKFSRHLRSAFEPKKCENTQFRMPENGKIYTIDGTCVCAYNVFLRSEQSGANVKDAPRIQIQTRPEENSRRNPLSNVSEFLSCCSKRTRIIMSAEKTRQSIRISRQFSTDFQYFDNSKT